MIKKVQAAKYKIEISNNLKNFFKFEVGIWE